MRKSFWRFKIIKFLTAAGESLEFNEDSFAVNLRSEYRASNHKADCFTKLERNRTVLESPSTLAQRTQIPENSLALNEEITLCNLVKDQKGLTKRPAEGITALATRQLLLSSTYLRVAYKFSFLKRRKLKRLACFLNVTASAKFVELE